MRVGSSGKGLLAALGLVSAVFSANACSTVVVGKNVSATGRVLVGHNEDDSGDLRVWHALVPPRTFQPGARMPAERGGASIPQVERTLGFYWSEVRDPSGGLPNADVFFNERGVLVVSNNGMGADPNEPGTEPVEGGIGYNLRRAVAERAIDARSALGVVTNLVSTWGYSMSGRNYIVADRNEAWLIAVVKGRRYVARRCPDDEVTIIANGYSIRTLHPDDLMSPNVAARYAADPSFDFMRTYVNPERYNSPYDTFRWKHMLRLITGRTYESDWPFSAPVGDGRKVSLDDVRVALSTHYEGTPDEVRPKHGGADRAKAGLPVCRAETVECTLCTFGETVAESELEVATGSPCETPFFRFRPFGGGLPALIDRSHDAVTRLESHLQPQSDGVDVTRLPSATLEKGGVTFDFAAFSAARIRMGGPDDPANVVPAATWETDVNICHDEVKRDAAPYGPARELTRFTRDGGVFRIEKSARLGADMGAFGFANLHCRIEGDWRAYLPESDPRGRPYRISFRYRKRHTLPQVGYSFGGALLIHYYGERDAQTGRCSKRIGRGIWDMPDDWDGWRDFSAEFATPKGAAGFDLELRHDGVGELEVKDLAVIPLPVRKETVDVRLSPHGLFDNVFAFSSGQAAHLTWEWRDARASERNLESYSLCLELPAGFSFVDDSFSVKSRRRVEERADGTSAVTIFPARRKVAFRATFQDYDKPGMLVRSTGPAGTKGTMRLVVSYDGEKVGGGEVEVVTIPKVLARSPERFYFSAMPGAAKTNWFDTPDGRDAFMLALVEYGVRLYAAEGGGWAEFPDIAQPMYEAFRRHGGRRVTACLNYVRNAYCIGPAPHPEDARYVSDLKPGADCYDFITRRSVCPKSVYEERGDFMTNTVPYLRSRLAGCDGVRSNYEPYMFFGNGCYCERCRAGFAKWAGLDERELAAKWPAAVKPRAELALKFQRYRSEELGRVAETLDRYIRLFTGGRNSMGFIPAPSWREYIYDPKNSDSDYSPRDYNEKLEWVAPWGPYVIWNAESPYVARKRAPLAHFVAARKMREMIDTTLPPGRRPKLTGGTQGLQCGEWVTQPEWLEMALDSYFFNRWEGVQAYYFPEGFDARYCRAYANAATRAADYETYVWDGVRCDGDFSVDPVAEYALPAPYVSSYMRDEKDVSLLQCAAWRKGTSVAVVAFNFWEDGEAFFDLKAKGLASGRYLVLAEGGVLWAKNRSEPGWTAAELERGVRLAVPASRTRVFEIVPEDERTLARSKSVLTAADAGRLFAERRPALVRAADADRADQSRQAKVTVDRKAEL